MVVVVAVVAVVAVVVVVVVVVTVVKVVTVAAEELVMVMVMVNHRPCLGWRPRAWRCVRGARSRDLCFLVRPDCGCHPMPWGIWNH